MARFLSPEKLTGLKSITLSPEESHHLSRVLRLSVGDKVEIIDGQGAVAAAEVIDNAAKRATVKLLSIERFPNRPKIHLAFSLPKSQALDFIIHRCSELGVAAFQPLISAHSLKPNHWNEERWRKVVEEVAKQCQAPYFPVLEKPRDLSQWLSSRDRARVLIYCYENERKPSGLSVAADQNVALVVGAEGGFSEEEIALFRQHGGVSLGLGANRLRAETAALTALVLVKRLIGEM